MLSSSEIDSLDFEASGSATPTNVIAMTKKLGSRKTLTLFDFGEANCGAPNQGTQDPNMTRVSQAESLACELA